MLRPLLNILIHIFTIISLYKNYVIRILRYSESPLPSLWKLCIISKTSSDLFSGEYKYLLSFIPYKTQTVRVCSPRNCLFFVRCQFLSKDLLPEHRSIKRDFPETRTMKIYRNKLCKNRYQVCLFDAVHCLSILGRKQVFHSHLGKILREVHIIVDNWLIESKYDWFSFNLKTNWFWILIEF